MLQEQTSNNKPSEEALLYYLVQFGAPLMRDFTEAYPVLDKKTVFEGALELVHQDPTLTRCFPLVVEQNRDFFENREELRHLLTTPKTTKTLGFCPRINRRTCRCPNALRRSTGSVRYSRKGI